MLKLQVSLCCLQFLLITRSYAKTLQFSEGIEDPCPNEWNCTITPNEYMVSTLHINTTAELAVISYSSMDYLLVICHGLKLYDFEKLLPALKVTEYDRVKMRQCPLSASFTLGHALRILGVVKCNQLDFDSKYLDNTIAPEHFRDLPEMNKFVLNISTSDENLRLPDDLLADKSLRMLNKLSLYSKLNEIPLNTFATLENLLVLHIGNNLQRLPEGVFQNQRKLTHLWLSNNKLRYLSKNVFHGAESVTSLDLSYNEIEYLAGDVFEKLINVQYIDLKNNQLKFLPSNLLKYNQKLIHLTMDNNKVPMTTVPPAMLANLPQLTLVSFTCGLLSIPGDVIANSSAVTDIWIYDNNLKTLPASLFASQTKLLYLALSNNSLSNLPDNLFQYNVLVTHLYLNNNRLHNISRKLFVNLERLQVVDLSNNLLQVDSSRFYLPFTHCTWLAKLRLSNNLLNQIPDDWMSPTSLRDFDLSHNNITSLNSQQIQQLITTKIMISLNNNQISRINLHNLENIQIRAKDEIIMDLNDNPMDCDCELLHFLLYINGDKHAHILSQIIFKANLLLCTRPPHLKERIVNKLDAMDLKCPTEAENCPSECSCHNRTFDNTLMIDCSNKLLNTFPDLSMVEGMSFTGVELNLNNTQLLALPMRSYPGYSKVTKLLVAGNNLSTIEAHQMPANLIYLDLRKNFLTTFGDDMLEFMNESKILKTVLMSQNPWLCECNENAHLLSITTFTHIIADFLNITCSNTPQSKYYYELQDLCYKENFNTRLVVSLCGVALILVSLVAFYYKFEREIKMWLYAKGIFSRFEDEDELDKEKAYDAFVSYSHGDEEFVVNHLQPGLENGRPPFKLCLHERDFMVGECIPDQIVRSINNSRRIIVVLSKNFLESRWSQLEFRLAHEASLTERRNRVIVIIYGDINDLHVVDDDLKSYLKTKTYLKWDSPWFWKKLRFAMPHPAANVPREDEINLLPLTNTST